VTEQQTRRKPGRPATGKRGNFTFRVTDKLRSELVARAEASGISVSEQIEQMLNQNIHEGGVIAEVLGGTHNRDFLRTIAAAIITVESMSGKKLTEDHHTNLAMRTAVRAVIDFQRLPPDLGDDMPDSKYGALLKLGEFYSLGTDAAKIAVGEASKARRRSEKPKESKS